MSKYDPLGDYLRCCNKSVISLSFENSQARERTQLLMDIANQENGIVIGT